MNNEILFVKILGNIIAEKKTKQHTAHWPGQPPLIKTHYRIPESPATVGNYWFIAYSPFENTEGSLLVGAGLELFLSIEKVRSSQGPTEEMRGNAKTVRGAEDGLAVPEYKLQVQDSPV